MILLRLLAELLARHFRFQIIQGPFASKKYLPSLFFLVRFSWQNSRLIFFLFAIKIIFFSMNQEWDKWKRNEFTISTWISSSSTNLVLNYFMLYSHLIKDFFVLILKKLVVGRYSFIFSWYRKWSLPASSTCENWFATGFCESFNLSFKQPVCCW